VRITSSVSVTRITFLYHVSNIINVTDVVWPFSLLPALTFGTHLSTSLKEEC